MPKIISYFLALLLVSCATTQKYDAKIKTWVGSTESQLLTTWGVPTTVFPIEDGKMFLFEKNLGTSSVANQYGGNFVVNTYSAYCKTTFIIKNGIITGYTFEGPSCISK